MIRVGTVLPGQVVSVKVQTGDRVKRGQPLAQLDDLDQRMALVGASGQVASAELADVQAERELIAILESEYGRPELPEDWSPDEVLDGRAGDAQIALFDTGAQLAKHQALLALTKRQLARRLIRAPMDGRVIARSVAPGESIGASPPGPALFVIGSDPAVLRIAAVLDAAYVPRVRPGPASFRVPATGDRSFPATVVGVAPIDTSQQSPALYEVSLEARNDDGVLVPGMTAMVSLPMQSPSQALQAPIRAVARAPREPALVVVDQGGSLHTVPVRPGVSDEALIEVDGGGIMGGELVLADADTCPINPNRLTASIPTP